MGKSPLVSAIVTTYKRPVKIVQRALQSITNQVYENIEIILVNDAPDEKELCNELKKMISSISKKIKYIEMEKNSGACAARNEGIKQSSGEFLAFLDDDDEWYPQKISEQVLSFENESIGLSYCNFLINEEGKENLRIHTKDLLPSGEIFNKLFEKNYIGSSSFPMIRKEALIKGGMFNTNMPALQDWEFWLRITQHCNVVYLNEPLGIYYFYSGDRISTHPERRIKGFELIYIQYKELLDENARLQASYLAEGITFYINGRDFKTALRLYKRILMADTTNVGRNVRLIIKILIRFFIPAKIV